MLWPATWCVICTVAAVPGGVFLVLSKPLGVKSSSPAKANWRGLPGWQLTSRLPAYCRLIDLLLTIVN